MTAARVSRSPRGFVAALTSPLGRAVLALFFVFLLGAIFNADDAFFRIGTHRDALRQMSVPGILASGMTIVIITGGIDLAVGSVMALAAVVFSFLILRREWSPPAAIAVTAAVGAAAGLFSGFLTGKLGIQPFIATLAMMVGARGLAKLASGGMKISTAIPTEGGGYRYVDVPAIFHAIDRRLFGDQIAVITVIFGVSLFLAWFLLARLRFGRLLFAIGGNEEAARLSGVPVAGTKIVAYVISGLFAAIAGIGQAAQEQQGDPETGQGYELTAIAMVVIGGTSLAGGRGDVLLTLMGVLSIGYLNKILSINAVPEAWRLLLTGVVIVLAVLLQKRRA